MLGVADPDAWAESAPAGLFERWRLYAEAEPFGPGADWTRHAVLAHCVLAAAPFRSGSPPGVEVFLPEALRPPREEAPPPPTPDESRAAMVTFALCGGYAVYAADGTPLNPLEL